MTGCSICEFAGITELLTALCQKRKFESPRPDYDIFYEQVL